MNTRSMPLVEIILLILESLLIVLEIGGTIYGHPGVWLVFASIALSLVHVVRGVSCLLMI